MDVARSVLVQRHRLKKDVLTASFGLGDIDQFEKRLPLLEDVGVALFADLAFKFLPVIGSNVLAVFFDVTLSLDPVLQALEVDEAY